MVYEFFAFKNITGITLNYSNELRAMLLGGDDEDHEDGGLAAPTSLLNTRASSTASTALTGLARESLSNTASDLLSSKERDLYELMNDDDEYEDDHMVDEEEDGDDDDGDEEEVRSSITALPSGSSVMAADEKRTPNEADEMEFVSINMALL